MSALQTKPWTKGLSWVSSTRSVRILLVRGLFGGSLELRLCRQRHTFSGLFSLTLCGVWSAARKALNMAEGRQDKGNGNIFFAAEPPDITTFPMNERRLPVLRGDYSLLASRHGLSLSL